MICRNLGSSFSGEFIISIFIVTVLSKSVSFMQIPCKLQHMYFMDSSSFIQNIYLSDEDILDLIFCSPCKLYGTVNASSL
jgi:hypothetical protein